ncbi:DUF4268 domain-containing protein [uncultured Catenibacterium sp.]|uniref:DUF4268 domain-containing protein n=1 Tax=uncultured Catenibacterium sp. TaxID=286142 RepID=UPI0025F6A22F|nr:DUF4268 domain-containing protein [uncultured Catenibacterium sp.]
MINLSKLEEIKDLRTVWPHEALDFTPWLSQDDNITLLADAIGIDITVDETESSVGDFNVDIFASETGTDRKIIIENQLEDTNHDHLGKLITYASGKSADIVVWLVKHAREEHKAAIEWRNNHTDDNVGFFLCEIKLYRIGNSEPAVKFEVIEKPNDWTKEVKKSESINETQQLRYDYWVAFEDYAFKNPIFAKNFKKRKPSKNQWLNFSIGSSACHIAVSQIKQRNELDVELYISDDTELYNSLYENKTAIELTSGLSFDWRELPDRKASRIVLKKSVQLENKNTWESQFEWLIDVMVKMKTTFNQYI